MADRITQENVEANISPEETSNMAEGSNKNLSKQESDLDFGWMTNEGKVEIMIQVPTSVTVKTEKDKSKNVETNVKSTIKILLDSRRIPFYIPFGPKETSAKYSREVVKINGIRFLLPKGKDVDLPEPVWQILKERDMPKTSDEYDLSKAEDKLRHLN